MPASGLNPHPGMQRQVIRIIGTNHQRRIIVA
jgi:hypothetical protein